MMLKSILKIIFFFIFFVTWCNSIPAQRDSLTTASFKRKDSVSLVLDKRPRHAFLLGLAIPGAGQIYNKRWWKLPLVYGGYAAAVYNIKFKRDLYKKYNGYYQEALKNGKVTIRQDLTLDLSQAKIYRDITRDGKDIALFTIIGVHLLVGLEAFVDAHLKNFNIDDDLSFKWSPQSGGIALVYSLH